MIGIKIAGQISRGKILAGKNKQSLRNRCPAAGGIVIIITISSDAPRKKLIKKIIMQLL